MVKTLPPLPPPFPLPLGSPHSTILTVLAYHGCHTPLPLNPYGRIKADPTRPRHPVFRLLVKLPFYFQTKTYTGHLSPTPGGSPVVDVLGVYLSRSSVPPDRPSRDVPIVNLRELYLVSSPSRSCPPQDPYPSPLGTYIYSSMSSSSLLPRPLLTL